VSTTFFKFLLAQWLLAIAALSMNSFPASQPPSSTRRYFAIGLSITTLFCALLYWLVYAFVTAQVFAGVYDGPVLLIIATIITFPPALLCTVITMILVGWRRCKLAWISLSSFAWPYVALLVYMIWTGARGLFK
jgi:hypothetical protein